MTWIYEELEGEEKIRWAESELHYEQYKGVTTMHMCNCGRKACRMNQCTLCWEEEIAILKKEWADMR